MSDKKTHKIWYLWVNGKEEGPYSFNEIRCHPALTPNLLVRQEGSKQWVPIRNVPELKQLFEDAEELTLPEKEENIGKPDGDELTLSLQEPSPFWFWLLVIAIVLVYIIIYLNER